MDTTLFLAGLGAVLCGYTWAVYTYASNRQAEISNEVAQKEIDNCVRSRIAASTALMSALEDAEAFGCSETVHWNGEAYRVMSHREIANLALGSGFDDEESSTGEVD